MTFSMIMTDKRRKSWKEQQQQQQQQQQNNYWIERWRVVAKATRHLKSEYPLCEMIVSPKNSPVIAMWESF